MAKILINVVETSSKGNCFILSDGSTNLILDFGTNKKYLEKNFLDNNIDKNNIAGILITHAHLDHSKALFEDISNYHQVYAPKGVWTELSFFKKTNFNFTKNEIVIDKWIKIPNSNWKFKAVRTIHNALDSVCYVIKNKNKKILYLTDSEYFENKAFKAMDCYLLECNYGVRNTLTKSLTQKHFINIQNHMNSIDVENFILKYRSHKNQLFLLIHLSSQNDGNFEIVDSLIKIYETKKIKIKKVIPSQINSFKIKI